MLLATQGGRLIDQNSHCVVVTLGLNFKPSSSFFPSVTVKHEVEETMTFTFGHLMRLCQLNIPYLACSRNVQDIRNFHYTSSRKNPHRRVDCCNIYSTILPHGFVNGLHNVNELHQVMSKL